jgi:hypothetical protein
MPCSPDSARLLANKVTDCKYIVIHIMENGVFVQFFLCLQSSRKLKFSEAKMAVTSSNTV